MEQVTKFGGKIDGAKADDLVDGHKLALKVFGSKACKQRDSGIVAFAYLWRRFGPPFSGSDDHKDLCCYYLSTKDPNVFLWVSPRGSPLPHCFGYVARRKFLTPLRAKVYAPKAKWDKLYEKWWIKRHPEIEWKKWKTFTKERQKEIQELYWKERMDDEGVWAAAKKELPKYSWIDDKAADPLREIICAAMRELLRPVYIRDVPINITGRCEDVVLPEALTKEAERSKYAGFGVPIRAMENMIKPQS